MGETFVVSLKYLNDSSGGGIFVTSTAWDHDGCTANRNTVQTGGTWLDACSQGVAGDWIIRAVVDCDAGDIPTATGWSLINLSLLLAVAASLLIIRNAWPDSNAASAQA